MIYTPNKEDKYVVCVNAGLIFSVFVPERDIVLFFINAAQRPRPHATTAGSSAVFGLRSTPHSLHADERTKPRVKRKKKKGKEASNARMSPALFSTWFVRTNEKVPDLRLWPDYAYAVWGSLQMNAVSIAGDYKLSLQLSREYDYLFYPAMKPGQGGIGNFGAGKRMKDRGTVRTSIQHAIRTGMTRHKEQVGHTRSSIGHSPAGPHMQEIVEFRKEIESQVRNPRVRKRLEEVEGNESNRSFGFWLEEFLAKQRQNTPAKG